MRSRRPLRTRKRMNPMNKERRAGMAERVWGSDAFTAWLHRLPCCIPGCDARDIEQCHAKSRAAGGDWTDCVPMCRAHHREQHDLGLLTFERKYGVDLVAQAAAVQRAWRESR